MYYANSKQRYTRAEKCEMRDIAVFENAHGDRKIWHTMDAMKRDVQAAVDVLREHARDDASFYNVVKRELFNGHRAPVQKAEPNTFMWWMTAYIMKSSVLSGFYDERQLTWYKSGASYPTDVRPVMSVLDDVFDTYGNEFKNRHHEVSKYFVMTYILCAHKGLHLTAENVPACIETLKCGPTRARLPCTLPLDEEGRIDLT